MCVRVYVYACVRESVCVLCMCVCVCVCVCVCWVCFAQVHVDPGASVFAATFIIVKLTMPVRTT